MLDSFSIINDFYYIISCCRCGNQRIINKEKVDAKNFNNFRPCECYREKSSRNYKRLFEDKQKRMSFHEYIPNFKLLENDGYCSIAEIDFLHVGVNRNKCNITKNQYILTLNIG